MTTKSYVTTDKPDSTPGSSPRPIDQYKTPNFPLIGATVAVACGEEHVREAFWTDGRAFCADLYALNSKHTELLLLPEGNPVNEAGFCFPTPAEIDVVIEELGKVLEATAPVSGPVSTQPPPFDPDLQQAYPTLVRIYLAMQFRIGAIPDDWQATMRTEFNDFPSAW